MGADSIVIYPSTEKTTAMTQKHKIQLFEEKKVRTVWDDQEEKWYFSIVDVCGVLTDSDYQMARKYWNKLKQRLKEEGNETVTNCHQLKFKAPDGRRGRHRAALPSSFCTSDRSLLCSKRTIVLPIELTFSFRVFSIFRCYKERFVRFV